MAPSTWLITGTTRGIGLELVRQLVAEGHTVLAVCRTPNADLVATGATVIPGVDLTRDDAPDVLRKALNELGNPTLDAVVMNAGIYPDSGRLGAIDADAVRHAFQVNTLGQLLLAEALLPLVRDGGRLAFITSRMGSIADNTSGGSYAYRISKAGLNMAARSLAVDLRNRGIAVSVIHPGFVRTDMTHGQGLIDADVSARGILARVKASSLDNSGSFWHQNGDPLPW